ncbi:MAG: arsenate reductase ArsC [Halobacteriota archaeon]
MNKRKILFLCTHNAARSQMAEGFVNALNGDRYEAYSAGSEPTEVHPCAIEAMAEKNIDIASQRAKPLDEYLDASFDYVVTMCADAQERCPIFPGAIIPGGTKYIHHAFDDPLADAGQEDAPCTSFRRVRDEIREWIIVTFGSL